MRKLKKIAAPLAVAIGLFILIIDTQTAFDGAQKGVQLCIQTLIPSLFPFFVLSGYFCRLWSQIRLPFLNPILRLCGIPSNAASLLIVGLLGGYPVGAKAISDAYQDGILKHDQAKRMLGFCSNAGPAFVFGVVGRYFENSFAVFTLFFILLFSALITGWLLPGSKSEANPIRMSPQIDNKDYLNSSLRAIAAVCGWVILFRVIIEFIQKWFLWLLPEILQVIVIGTLELSNGCASLCVVQNDGIRFIISTGMLAFGGLCVYLQTVAVTGSTGIGWYFPGKVLQCLISIFLAAIAQLVLFDIKNQAPLTALWIPIIPVGLLLTGIKIRSAKKTVAFSRTMMYNT